MIGRSCEGAALYVGYRGRSGHGPMRGRDEMRDYEAGPRGVRWSWKSGEREGSINGRR